MIKDILLAYIHGQHGTLQVGHKLLEALKQGKDVVEIVRHSTAMFEQAEKFLNTCQSFQAIQQIYQLYREKSIHILSITEEGYPSCLLHCQYPPLILFYRGDISLLTWRKLGVIGHDPLSFYGERILADIIVPLPQMVFTGSLMFKTSAMLFDKIVCTDHKCITVLNTHFERYCPLKHMFLQRKVETVGLVLTEVPLYCHQLANAHRVGELVVGVSSCLCVVETAKQTLAMFMAYCGIEQSKDVIVAPGALFEERSKGNQQLLQQGALYLMEQQDIIDCLSQSRV